MQESQIATQLSNPHEWAERSEFWIAESSKPKRKRRVRERNSHPLILTGHGTSLRIEKGTLLIKQGFSHYPQKAEQFRFFKGDLQLPRIIILLDGSGSISFEVLNWLGTQGVALARIKWDGSSAIFASGAGFSANADKLRWQFELQSNQAKRIQFAKDLIGRKLINCAGTLQSQFSQSEKRERAIEKVRKGAAQLKAGSFTDMQEIRAIEGKLPPPILRCGLRLKCNGKQRAAIQFLTIGELIVLAVQFSPERSRAIGKRLTLSTRC